mgnify:CR=1 FL=1
MTEEEKKIKEAERNDALREYQSVGLGRADLSFEEFLRQYYGEEAAREEQERSQRETTNSSTNYEIQEQQKAVRGAQLTEKYAQEPASIRMAKRLFTEDSKMAQEFAGELHRQGYDTYIQNNSIDVDDMTQWDPKTVNQMYKHLDKFLKKKDYQEFERKQKMDEKMDRLKEPTGGQLPGVKTIHDQEWAESHADQGQQEADAKTNLENYCAEKLEQSTATPDGAYRNQLNDKYAQESASRRMARRLFIEDSEMAQEFADELHRQGYDTYIQKNHIDVDDMMQWDSKTVNQMYAHLDKFLKKKDYQDFERKQKIDETVGCLEEPDGGKLPGVKTIHDREWVMNHGYQGQLETDAKTTLNDYRADKLEQSNTTSEEAYFNQFTKKGFDFERAIRNLIDDPDDDVFGEKKVDAAKSARRDRAEEEHPVATLFGEATNESLEAVYGKALNLKKLIRFPFQSKKQIETFEKIYDKIPEKIKKGLEGVINDLYETVIDTVKDQKSMGEAAVRFTTKVVNRFASPYRVTDKISDPSDFKEILQDGRALRKGKEKAWDKAVDEMAEKVIPYLFDEEKEIKPIKEKHVPLTEEELRYYKAHYDKAVDLAISDAEEKPGYAFMAPTEKLLALYDARKEAEEKLRQKARVKI